MVYGFTKQSGGTVKIYSEVGVGTTIRLYLPRAPAGMVEFPHPAEANRPIRGGHETILVVDDNAEVRAVVESQLASLGYRVLKAEHGPRALEVLHETEDIDLLFTDVVMPHGMSGFDLAVEAVRRRPGLRVLFTSGFPGATLPPPSSFDGTVNFISKPYRRQELAQRLRETLDAPAALTTKEGQ
jgi:CheY-like chemotaxis protein